MVEQWLFIAEQVWVVLVLSLVSISCTSMDDCKANNSLAETVPTWLCCGRATVVLARNGNQDLAAHVGKSQEAISRAERSNTRLTTTRQS